MSDDELLREAEVLAARYAEHYDAEHAEAMKELVRLCMRRLRGTSRLVAEARKREHIKLENIKEFERQRLAARQKLADELEVVRRAVALAMARTVLNRRGRRSVLSPRCVSVPVPVRRPLHKT